MDSATLDNLLSDATGLERLEKQIASFNIFEATGAVRRELRHSDFIGFLFDSSETHKFGDALYKIFCHETGIILKYDPILVIAREWEHIDILIRDKANQTIIAIENKIDTGEHSDQLQRYRKILESTYPDYARRYFYLTKIGEEPTDDHWEVMSYANLRSHLQSLSLLPTVKGDVATLVNHYEQMIERHFMPNNEIAELCRKIYGEHKRAIDLIIEHRPEGGEDIYYKILELIEQNSELELDNTVGIHNICFITKLWDEIPGIKTSIGGSKSGRVLYFAVENSRNEGGDVCLKLYVGPTADIIRGQVIEFAKENSDTFHVGKRGDKWTQIYRCGLLSQDDMSDDDRLKILEANWNRFFSGDFTRINQLLLSFRDR